MFLSFSLYSVKVIFIKKFAGGGSVFAMFAGIQYLTVVCMVKLFICLFE